MRHANVYNRNNKKTRTELRQTENRGERKKEGGGICAKSPPFRLANLNEIENMGDEIVAKDGNF